MPDAVKKAPLRRKTDLGYHRRVLFAAFRTSGLLLPSGERCLTIKREPSSKSAKPHLLRFERVDNLGAYSIPSETGFLISSVYDTLQFGSL
jgi:hypothetical protein